jgi:hypothetical protein
MPALPPVPKVLRVVAKISDGSDLNTINRFFFQYDGGAPTAAQLLTLAGAMDTAWTLNLAPIFGIQVSLLGHIITDLSSSTGAVGESTTTVPGTRAGAALPAAAAVVMSLKTARRYRGGHPRNYLAAGVSTDLNTRQTWTGAFTTATKTGYDAYIAAMSTNIPVASGPGRQVNVSYFAGFTAVPRPPFRTRNVPNVRPVPLIDVIIATKASSKLGSQRRRNLQSL